MPSDRRNMPEQELSIKKREQELFLEESSEEQDQSPDRPFEEYLRETPAAPLSIEVKMVLWIAGVVVAILFAAAVWKASRSSSVHAKPRPSRPAAEAQARLSQDSPPTAWIASQIKERTDSASVARRHRRLSTASAGSIRLILQVPNSGRRVES